VVGTETGIGSGKENTQKLIGAMGSTAFSNYSDGSNTTPQYAAKMCAEYLGGGHADWFLPSKEELSLMYHNLYLKNLGEFSGDYFGLYWSSSEIDNNEAWLMYFDDGGQRNYDRNNLARVRPIRAF
jgi:hypothetical protein